MPIPQRVNLITLGVADISASTYFYENLGWAKSHMSKAGEVSFFGLGNIVFGLYPRNKLAADAGVSDDSENTRFRGVALAINASSEALVDEYLASAVAAGGVLVKPAEKVFWGGYSGYFTDPDGHLWEVAHNPFAPLDENGMMQLPE